jgi:ATP-dependent DNA helicase RecG
MVQETAPIGGLRGVGSKTAALFSEMGVETIGDLLAFLPKGYKERRYMPVAHARHGDRILTRAICLKCLSSQHTGSFAKTELLFSQDGREFRCVFYNQPYRRNMAKEKAFLLFGTVRVDKRGPVFLNPETEPDSGDPYLKEGLYPVYSLPFASRLTGRKIALAEKRALLLAEIEEEAPLWLLDRLSLPGRARALECVHQPHSREDLMIGQRYFAARRLIAHQASMLRRPEIFEKRETARLSSDRLPAFVEALGIPLTKGQKGALEDVARDLGSGRQMNRLIEGDVGSGKTAVALCACFLAASGGYQAAFLAPTEALARQHFHKCSESLRMFGIEPALLTGSMRAAERRRAERAAESGSAGVVFGTHALFSGNVAFKSLLLFAFDEQKSFVGALRALVLAKALLPPHVLALTATPIPRTLVFALAGEMDTSRIMEMPKGRKPVQTFVASPAMRQRIYAFIEKRVMQLEKAFIVCPAIDQDDYASVESVYAEAKSAMPSAAVTKLTGAMGEAERQKGLDAFLRGESSVLIATTIIEVGIDVPEATVMLVLDAHRFGLSQLHQLRGRVGRSSRESWCVLEAPQSAGPDAIGRLRALKAMHDGFAIAREDLKLRGGGERLGMRQSGRPSAISEDAMDFPDVAEEARAAAGRLLASSKAADRAFLEKIESEDGASMELVVLN